MKRVNKLAAAVALALSAGIAQQASAIGLKHDGRGDALLFPVFNGYIENYFTVYNTDNNWVQAHVRFRGAAWTGELLDFDVILSPGDVFVFRLADIDGDGYWEIDQSVDMNNYRWAGIVQSCGQEVNGATASKDMANCIDQSTLLIPDANDADGMLTYDLTPIKAAYSGMSDESATAMIEHHRHTGYVEVFGEGIFLDLTQADGRPTHAQMGRLADTANRGKLAAEGQREVSSPAGGKVGTSLWSWVDAQNATGTDGGEYAGYHLTRMAADVKNSLAGSAFVTLPGQSSGVAYNAEALTDFRTTDAIHRIDNYSADFAVIIHDENSVGPAGGVSPRGDYVYTMMTDSASAPGSMLAPTDRGEDNRDESLISFNNTWGPTIMDGDDANGVLDDPWDLARGAFNSIEEVEDLIEAGGQDFSAFYFDGQTRAGDMAKSWYFAWMPTKFYYAELPAKHDACRRLLTSSGSGCTGSYYLAESVTKALQLAREVSLEVWDTDENFMTVGSAGAVDCPQSPCLTIAPQIVKVALGEELSVFNIDWIKSAFNPASGFDAGRVSVRPVGTWGTDVAPMLMYTFEMIDSSAGTTISNWRPMHR